MTRRTARCFRSGWCALYVPGVKGITSPARRTAEKRLTFHRRLKRTNGGAAIPLPHITVAAGLDNSTYANEIRKRASGAF